jgi:hypothetical protein
VVDETSAVPHQRQPASVDEAARLVRERDVERNDVGLAEQLVQRPIRRVVVWLAARVEDPHLEASRALRHRTSGPSEADDAEGGAGDLVAPQRLVGPAAPPPAGADDPVAGCNSPKHREDQPHRQVGGRRRRDPGRVRHDDSPLAAGVDVDEVVARAVVRDHSQLREAFEGRAVHLLGDDRQCLDVVARRPEVAVLDIRELLPRGAGETA